MNPSHFTVRVNLPQRSYSIRIGTGTLPLAGSFLKELRLLGRTIVVADARVEKVHARAVAESLTALGAQVDVVAVESGEPSKCLAQADRLWNELLELRADRRTLLLAVGGGVVGDLAGFVAATYARGIAYVQAPTTLVGQVDSSIGGKVGINLPGAKNMVGAFWQPAGVLIDTRTLETLPGREFRSGLAEVVKYGVILDAEFFGRLERDAAALLSRQDDVLQQVIARCCRLKADVVVADEREETGHRAVLNYGHTFCHALETVTGYSQILHGEGVSIGMMCAARLAQRLGRVDQAFVERQRALLTAMELPVTLPDVDHEFLLAAMIHDKKAHSGRLRFVLPTRLGHVETVTGIDLADVRAALEDVNA